MSGTTGRKAVLDGEFVEAAELTIPVTDAGFVLGVTVAEQIRTFGGQLFRLEEHVDRLFNSLRIVDVSVPHSREQIADLARQLAAANWSLERPDEDIGLSIFVTPGGYPTLDPRPSGPRLGMHTYPLPCELWADKFTEGERLSVVDFRQVPTACWPAELKCRSRMHYYLADKQARRLDPSSRAILLDLDGFVAEATTANVVVHHESEGIVCPPPEKILAGISVAVLAELAEAEGVAWTHRDIRVEELTTASEVLLSSTSVCALPVSAVNGAPVGPSPFEPGPIYQRLIARWNELTGVDVAEQARLIASRRSGEA